MIPPTNYEGEGLVLPIIALSHEGGFHVSLSLI